MKRFLYVYPFNTESSGVNHKIKGQISALKKKYEVFLIFASYKKNDNKIKKLYAFMIFQFRVLLESLKADILYVRYSPYVFYYNFLLCFLSVFKKVYLEYNTVTESELKIGGKKFVILLDRLYAWGWKYFPIKHIVVTREIGTSLNYKDISASRIIYAQNGYHEYIPLKSKIKLRKINEIKEFKKRFVKTAIFTGNNFPWHGLEKIVSIFQNKGDIGLLIVGDIELAINEDNIIKLGKLDLDTLTELYKYVDFGVGTFNLELNHMKEACPLKTREYLFNGLPILVNYHDCAEDIEELKPFVFNYRKDKNAFFNIISNDLIRNDIRKAARKHLSWDKLLEWI